MIGFLSFIVLIVIAVLVYGIWKKNYVVPTVDSTPILPEPEETTGSNDNPDPLEYPGEIVKDPIPEPETPGGHPFDKPSQPFEDPDFLIDREDFRPEPHKPELEEGPGPEHEDRPPHNVEGTGTLI